MRTQIQWRGFYLTITVWGGDAWGTPTFTENLVFSVMFWSKSQTWFQVLCLHTADCIDVLRRSVQMFCTFKAPMRRFLGGKAAAWSVNQLLRSNIWCVPAPQNSRYHFKPHQDGLERIIHTVPSVAGAPIKSAVDSKMVSEAASLSPGRNKTSLESKWLVPCLRLTRLWWIASELRTRSASKRKLFFHCRAANKQDDWGAPSTRGGVASWS